MPVTVGGFLALLKLKVAPGHDAILPVEGHFGLRRAYGAPQPFS